MVIVNGASAALSRTIRKTALFLRRPSTGSGSDAVSTWLAVSVLSVGVLDTPLCSCSSPRPRSGSLVQAES